MQEEERDKLANDRREKSKLQKDYEHLERNFLELDMQRKSDIQNA
jgi:hypothetical protein